MLLILVSLLMLTIFLKGVPFLINLYENKQNDIILVSEKNQRLEQENQNQVG